METNKRINDMTDEEISLLSKEELITKSFQETINEINLDTYYLSFLSKNIVASTILSICITFFNPLFVFSFFLPLFFLYFFKRVKKSRSMYLKLFKLEYDLYIDEGTFSNHLLNSFKEKIDLTIKLY
jgi:Na+-transporting NADH:ubiquinone oxidoreductase subunit NqrB